MEFETLKQLGITGFSLILIYVIIKDVVVPLLKWRNGKNGKDEDKATQAALQSMTNAIAELTKNIGQMAAENHLEHREILQDTNFLKQNTHK